MQRNRDLGDGGAEGSEFLDGGVEVCEHTGVHCWHVQRFRDDADSDGGEVCRGGEGEEGGVVFWDLGWDWGASGAVVDVVCSGYGLEEEGVVEEGARHGAGMVVAGERYVSAISVL